MLNIHMIKSIRIVCDKCGVGVEVSDLPKHLLIKELRSLDWAIGKKCLCPACRETPQLCHLRSDDPRRTG